MAFWHKLKMQIKHKKTFYAKRQWYVLFPVVQANCIHNSAIDFLLRNCSLDAYCQSQNLVTELVVLEHNIHSCCSQVDLLKQTFFKVGGSRKNIHRALMH